jgi:hypothetical protein
MIIKIDPKAIKSLTRCDQVPVAGVMRYYYHAGPNFLFHLVSRCGPIELLAGQTVEAAIGWGEGWHRKCHPTHEGLQLTKVTLFNPSSKPHAQTLSNIIQGTARKKKRSPKNAPWTKKWGNEE